MQITSQWIHVTLPNQWSICEAVWKCVRGSSCCQFVAVLIRPHTHTHTVLRSVHLIRLGSAADSSEPPHAKICQLQISPLCTREKTKTPLWRRFTASPVSDFQLLPLAKLQIIRFHPECHRWCLWSTVSNTRKERPFHRRTADDVM